METECGNASLDRLVKSYKDTTQSGCCLDKNVSQELGPVLGKVNIIKFIEYISQGKLGYWAFHVQYSPASYPISPTSYIIPPPPFPHSPKKHIPFPIPIAKFHQFSMQ